MVTSNKQPDKKIVKMADQNNGAVVPQRTLLGEVNEHITCPLCRGYYIDATTIVECLHSFCRSCIIKHLQVKSYCPVCEMMINSAKPNIKLDKALQDIVYKLVPGLFQREMERRQQFYASRPGPAASATPEQRGEDTERIIFSPEDVISFSLEYADVTDTDSISSKSSDSNDFQTQTGGSRRYLQCPAVVNISHLKKFLSMKFDIDSTQFAIVILYKKVPLPDYYTLMDIAYIYNWKRNEPMRFFYQIIDYVAIRNRLFDNNRKESHFPDRKSSPASTEDTNVSSPAPNLNDHGSEASSGTDSPMPENNASKASEPLKKVDVCSDEQNNKDVSQGSMKIEKITLSPAKKNDDEVEKSQFLNSFELTAKNNAIKCSPSQSNMDENKTSTDSNSLNQSNSSKIDDNLKRKQNNPNSMPEMKKLKIELEKTKLSHNPNTPTDNNAVKTTEKDLEINLNTKSSVENTNSNNQLSTSTVKNISSTIPPQKDVKQQITATKQQPSDNQGLKTLPSGASNIGSSKPKSNEVTQPLTTQPSSTVQKTVSPLKLQIPKQDVLLSNLKPAEANKSVVKKMPDLRPSVPMPQVSQNKGQSNQIGKFRMDLIANNSDLTTTDHTKTLPQVKTPLSAPIPSQTSGDPLKSLFDSCKINIPPSLSITLTDQKVEPRSQHETANTDQKKILNKNLASASNVSTHKAPSPPVHNYIEILKLPDTDPKKLKTDNNLKFNPPGMVEGNSSQSKPLNKPSESSTKGPIPNLKPISDTKLGKQSGNFSAPITFQQTFEQQLQSMQSEKKGKLGKNKAQVPKLVPATPKSFTAANKLNMSNAKAPPINIPLADHKLSAALDLSTPHNIQSQLSPQQTKAFETMQSIANLAKKHNMPNKLLPLAMSQANVFSSLAAMPISTVPTPLRIPSTSGITQPKIEKAGQSSSLASMRQEGPSKGNLKPPNNLNATIPTQGYPVVPHSSPNPSQTTPRPQTRSPSSSPKLVIAEEKQAINALPDNNVNQSNQITSTQVSNILAPKSESPKAAPGPSKPGPKPMKPMIPVAKMPGIRQPIPPSIPPMPKPNAPMASPADYLTQRQFLSAQHAMLRQQMDLHGIHFQNPWLKAQQQYDLLKNMSNMTHQSQNDFNKDKQ